MPICPGFLIDYFEAVPQNAVATDNGALNGSSPSSSIPPVPGWDTARPYLTGQFILEVSAKQAAGRASAEVLESYPPSLQETLCELAVKHGVKRMGCVRS